MRKSFTIERKVFFVEKVRDWVVVEERGKGSSFKVNLNTLAAEWLFGQLKGLRNHALSCRSVGSKAFADIHLVLSIKSNKAGWFLSVLCFRKFGNRSRSSICIPLDNVGSGLEKFVEALAICLEQNFKAKVPTNVNSNGLAKVGDDVQDLAIGGGFAMRASFLRSCAAVVTSDKPIQCWKKTLDELHQVLSLLVRLWFILSC